MDAPLAAAARALAAGDPLDALHHVALRGDPPALALRGIALAQLGDLERARALLRARAFRPEQELARARLLAEGRRGAGDARPGLARRNAGIHPPGPAAARRPRQRRACPAAACAAPAAAGPDAAVAIAGWDQAPLPAAARAVHAAAAGIALRRLQAEPARLALAQARAAARESGIGALQPRPMRCRAC